MSNEMRSRHHRREYDEAVASHTPAEHLYADAMHLIGMVGRTGTRVHTENGYTEVGSNKVVGAVG